MTKERVLVVDDRQDNIEFILDYVLIPHGYQALTARDGAEGLDLALKETPDLILLDVNMPRLSGMEVLEELKKRGQQVPVILMTFHGSETLAARAFRLGVKDYIIKPFQADEMAEAIERALAEVRLRRERDQLTARLIAVNRQMERRVRELNTLYSIGKSVTAVLDLEVLLKRLVEAAVYLTGAEEGLLLLVDEATNELYIMAAQGVEEKVAHSLRLRVDDSIAGRVISSGQPVVISGSEQKIKTAYLVQSLLYVPLNVKNRAIGILGVDNRQDDRSFSKQDLSLLSALADYAAIALENARLFGEVEGERRRLGAILQGVAEPVIVTNPRDNRVSLINDAALKAFDLGSDPVEGRLLDGLIGNAGLLKLIARAGEDGGDTLTTEVPLADGRIMHAGVTAIPSVGKVIVMQDITHLKELDRMKSEFVSTVSHDLRSPLTSIKGYAEMLPVIGELSDQQKEFTQRIVGGVTRITELIEDLLDIGRIESGVDWTMAPCQMAKIAGEVVSDLQGEVQSRGQALELECPAVLPLVMGNEVRLRQVLSNLIGNAIKYTATEGAIRVSLSSERDQVVVRVQDSGVGIAEADLPYVFDKFYRVRNEKTEMVSGTGLGLSIARSIVEKHHGRIWVESQVDKGTIFTFALPTLERE